MNENDLKKHLANAAKTPVNSQAKQRAIDSAMAEFSALHSQPQSDSAEQSQKNTSPRQGFWQWLRLTFSSNKQDRRKDMTNTHNVQQKWFLGGIATTCVAVFGVLLATYNPSVNTPFEEAPLYSLDAPEHSGTTNAEIAEAEIEVAGIRKSLQQSAELKRESTTVVSAIHADDIGSMPDTAVAEALQRTQGIVIEKEQAKLAMKRPMAAVAPHPHVGAKLKSEFTDRDSEPYSPSAEEGRDRFEAFETNPIKLTQQEPVSTFSIDVDTASYSFVRRQLNAGVLPQKSAVRLEEMLNYFDYDYPLPATKTEPFSRTVSVLPSPWHPEKKLIHIGIKGYQISEQPKSNLVFLLDVSGSMNSPDKLPLVKQSMQLLLSTLRPDDSIAIAVYAGAAGTVLAPTPVAEKQKILQAINALQPGGSTAGAEGIKLAYQLAESTFKKDAVNRIILATDGDFNVGISNGEELKGFIERKRESGIYLSVLGFGGGNYNDALMQQLAQNGNGVAAYIDTLSEAQKVLVNEATSNLFPIAKDVKIQVEFNPATVAEYRLLGYETRALKREDFNNDAVDAGEIGAGHTVTALYEITPVGSNSLLVDPSRYASKNPAKTANTAEYAFLKMRYKLPSQTRSTLLTTVIDRSLETTDPQAIIAREARFATAVAGFAQLLKDRKYTGDWSFDDAIALAQANKGSDDFGYRTEFIQLIRKASVAQGM